MSNIIAIDVLCNFHTGLQVLVFISLSLPILQVKKAFIILLQSAEKVSALGDPTFSKAHESHKEKRKMKNFF